jgi:hypothetical protein
MKEMTGAVETIDHGKIGDHRRLEVEMTDGMIVTTG